MQRIGSCIAFILTLACPVLCPLASSHDDADAPACGPVCPGCPCEPSEPQQPPCETKTCLCSPFLLHKWAPNQGNETTRLFALWFATNASQTDGDSRAASLYLPASALEISPGARARDRSVPLLI